MAIVEIPSSQSQIKASVGTLGSECYPCEEAYSK